MSFHPFQTNRVTHLNTFAGIGELTGFFIAFEDHHTIGFLVGHQQKIARRVDGEIARHVTLGTFMTNGGELAAFINGENGNGVRWSAVGSIQEFTIGLNMNIGRPFFTGKTGRIG